MDKNTLLIAFAVCTIASFLVIEYRGLIGKNNTFSEGLRELSAKWPLTIFVWGCLVGALAIHLWGC